MLTGIPMALCPSLISWLIVSPWELSATVMTLEFLTHYDSNSKFQSSIPSWGDLSYNAVIFGTRISTGSSLFSSSKESIVCWENRLFLSLSKGFLTIKYTLVCLKISTSVCTVYWDGQSNSLDVCLCTSWCERRELNLGCFVWTFFASVSPSVTWKQQKLLDS